MVEPFMVIIWLILTNRKEYYKKIYQNKETQNYIQNLIHEEIQFLSVPLTYDCLLSIDELRFSDNERKPGELIEACLFYEGKNNRMEISKLVMNNKDYSSNERFALQNNESTQDGGKQQVTEITQSGVSAFKNVKFPRHTTVAALPDSRFMFMGGMFLNKSMLKTTNKCFIYNPAKDHFTPVISMHEPRANHCLIKKKNS